MDALSIGPLLLAMREQFPTATPARESDSDDKTKDLLAQSWVTYPAAKVAFAEWLDRFERWPTSNQLESVLRSTRADIRVADHEAAIAACVTRFGHDFLAMVAIPWNDPCTLCYSDEEWTAFGGELDEPLRMHAHIFDSKRLAPVLTIGEHQAWLYFGWTEATLWQAAFFAQEHTPDGRELKPPHRFHPLRSRMHPDDWHRREAHFKPRRAELLTARLDRFLGRGLKPVVAKCGACGDRGQTPVYGEEFGGRVDTSRVEYWVPCSHCTPATTGGIEF